jgi:hypothetical protein
MRQLLPSATYINVPIGFNAAPYVVKNCAYVPKPSADPLLHVPAATVPLLQTVVPASVVTKPIHLQ